MDRLAALSREEQQVDAQLRDFRRRAAIQRAAAQDELRTLRGGGNLGSTAAASLTVEDFAMGKWHRLLRLFIRPSALYDR